MNKSETARWVALLHQNIEKDHSSAPDFVGQAFLSAGDYDVAAWFSTIRKGDNRGRPYLSMQWSSRGDGTVSQRVNVFLWEVTERAAETDPHFKARENLGGQSLKFAARIEPSGTLHRLHVVIEPFTAEEDLSPIAREVQEKLNSFVKEARLRLPAKKKSEPPRAEATAPKAEPDDGVLEAEPSDIPFKTTVYKDVQKSRLNRLVL
jgi:hypothetical protein